LGSSDRARIADGTSASTGDRCAHTEPGVVFLRSALESATKERMSGHNRWSKIKHKKEASDNKKSKVWTKVIKEITVSARMGGGDPNGNPRLRTAIDTARGQNMPTDTIERAIKKGIGDLDGITYEEFTYEVFGPGGTAILVDVMTDNRNRTAGEIRNLLTKHNGNLSGAGSVGWMFKKQGLLVFEKVAGLDENKLTDAAIELGAEDVRSESDSFVVVTEPKEFERIRDGLAKAGLPAPATADVTMVPQNTVHLTGKEAESAIKLLGLLEDHDDVQNVHSNLDVDESTLESVAS
jgi:YebC/PmpR family DNA-binding regulatory protein